MNDERQRQTKSRDADLSPLSSSFSKHADDDEPTTTTNDRTEAAALARKKHGIRVNGGSGTNGSGNDIPPPLDCFAAALRRAPEAGGVRAKLERNLLSQGWLEPTPIQRQILPLLSSGREVLAIAPTGSGKTLAFLLPIVVGCARAREKERKKRHQQKEEEGKRGAKSFPLSSSYPRALILSPTRELAAQTSRVLAKLAEGTGVRGKMLTRGAAAAGAAFEGVDVLLATPLRLARALAAKKKKSGRGEKTSKRKGGSSSSSDDDEGDDEEHEEDDDDLGDDDGKAFPASPSPSPSPPLSLASVRWIVLDEADRLLSDGMLPQVDAALAACGVGSSGEEESGKRKKKNAVGALFSATLPEATEALARSFLVDPARVTVGERGASASHVEQKLVFVGGGGGGGGEGEEKGGKKAKVKATADDVGRRAALRQLLASGAAPPPTLVFVSSAERASELAESLAAEGVRAAAATGAGAGGGGVGAAQSATAARAAAVASLRRGDTWVLVATDVLARGLDFVGARSVVSFDFPATASDYVHRVGRVGRGPSDKAKGCVALTFFGEGDAALLRPVAGAMRAAGCEVPEWMLGLARPGRGERSEAKRRSAGGGGGRGGGGGGARKRSKK